MSAGSQSSGSGRTSSTEEDFSVLLYDGACAFCAAAVQFILKHERPHTLRFSTRQSEFGKGVCERHPEVVGTDSLIWFDNSDPSRKERVLVRSDAVLRVAEYMGGPWRVLALGRIAPRFLRDTAYKWVALRRHRLRAKSPQGECPVPPPNVRARMLD